jgi:hypothetical protein
MRKMGILMVEMARGIRLGTSAVELAIMRKRSKEDR